MEKPDATTDDQPTTFPARARSGPPTSPRLLALDAYRGLIMLTLLAGGIFHSLKGVPGWNWLYVQNEHVAWVGCVYWDLIQPSFMFMVGAAMPFAFARRAELGDSWSRQFGHAIFRAFNLIVLGFLLDNFGAEKVQIGFIRVLQQIGIGYLIAFFIVGRSFRLQALVAGGILVGYQCAWMFNPWNGPGGPWAMGQENLGSVFDRWILGRNYSGYYVGLNALPAAVTIMFGVMAGQLIRQTSRPTSDPASARRTMLILLGTSVAGIALGLAVSPWFPLIKRIWTPSFAIYAGGWNTLMLPAFYWGVEVMGWRSPVFPLVVVGTNSIAAYVIGNAFGGWFRSLSMAWLNGLPELLGEVGFPVFQRALFAFAAWAVLYWLYRRKIFFKV